MSRTQDYVESLIQANRLLGGRKWSLRLLHGAILAHERVGFSLNNIIETGGPTPQTHRAGACSAFRPRLIHGSTLRLLSPDAKGWFQYGERAPGTTNHPLASFARWPHIAIMADDARKKLQARFAKIGERALARIHENRPDLRDKNLEETVKILKAEASLVRSAYHSKKRYPLLDE